MDAQSRGQDLLETGEASLWSLGHSQEILANRRFLSTRRMTKRSSARDSKRNISIGEEKNTKSGIRSNSQGIFRGAVKGNRSSSVIKENQ